VTLAFPHPSQRAIGVKLKGFRFIFERTREILHSQGVEIEQAEFVPLITAFEVALTAGLGAAVMATAERERFDEKYATARALIKSVHFDPRELLQAA
jgi:hypothetical protein